MAKSLLPELCCGRTERSAGPAREKTPAQKLRLPAFAIEQALAELLIAEYDQATARRMLQRIVVH